METVSQETTSQEILTAVKNSGGGGLLPVYVTGDPTPAHYEWSMSGCTPYVFQYGASVVYKNELHILGGSGNHFGHWKWDGENWLNVSILPYDFLNGTAVVYNDAIHILGGDGNNYGHYKWNGQQWVEDVSSFATIVKASAVVYNSEIHILSAKKHIAFNGTSWYQVSTQNFVAGCKAVVYNSAIHVFYGSSFHYKWDGSSWTSLSMIYIYGKGDVVVFNNKIHIFYDTTHYIWNESANTWSSQNTKVPQSQFVDGKAVVYKNQLHLLGGSSTSQNHFIWNSSSDTYTGVKSLPKCFSNGMAVMHDGEIHLFGADDDTYGHYKWDGVTLTYVSKMPYPMSTSRDVFIVEFENELHLFCGSHHYKYQENAWISLASTPATYSLQYCCIFNGKIYVKRGSKSGTSYSDYWNPDTDTWTNSNDITGNYISVYYPSVNVGQQFYSFYSYTTGSSQPTYCYIRYFNGSTWDYYQVSTISIEDGGASPEYGTAYEYNGIIYLLDNKGKRFQLKGKALVYVDTLPFIPKYSSAVIYNDTHTVLCGTNAQSNITQLVPVKPTYRAYNYILPKGTQIIGTSSMIPLSSNLKVIDDITLQVTETGEVALLVGDTSDDRKLIIKG